MFDFVKKKLGWGGEPEVTLHGSLRVRNNGTITVDTTEFLINDEYLTMVAPPNEPMRVTDIGKTDLLGVQALRCYLKTTDGQEYWLQLIEDPEGRPIQATLYSQVNEIHPQSASEWDDWITNLNSGDPMEFNDITYSPVWNSLVAHSEEIVPSAEGEETYTSPLQTMLYDRDCSEEQDRSLVEQLLVSIEDEERISMYVGIDVPVAGLTVV